MELAVALVLLAGAGLLGKCLYRLLHVKMGFDPTHLATASLMKTGQGESKPEDLRVLYSTIAPATQSPLPAISNSDLIHPAKFCVK